MWTDEVLQAKTTIAAAVPAHGTVVYRVRPLRVPSAVPPLVTVGATLGTLVPEQGATLTTTVTNRGAGSLRNVSVRASVPPGWTVTATAPPVLGKLPTDASFETAWTVTAPAGTPAGQYPITLTATHRRGTSTSQLVSTVVNAPPDGRRYLSTITPAVSEGQLATDLSTGGSLITIAGRVYQRGIGTTTPATIDYYLGGRCTHLTTDVGVDDETQGSAKFTIYTDELATATTTVNAGDQPVSLTADLSGAVWLRLATEGNAHADWAAPAMACGNSTPTDPVSPVDRTLFSFESGTEQFTIANPDDGGTVTRSTAFHTDGEHGLEVTTPLGGNWYGTRLSESLDLTGTSMLKADVRADQAAGTTGEIAVQTGPGLSWCQGSRWAWTDAGKARTISVTFAELDCPAGVTLDPTQINAVWIFLNGGHVYLDDIRAE